MLLMAPMLLKAYVTHVTNVTQRLCHSWHLCYSRPMSLMAPMLLKAYVTHGTYVTHDDDNNKNTSNDYYLTLSVSSYKSLTLRYRTNKISQSLVLLK